MPDLRDRLKLGDAVLVKFGLDPYTITKVTAATFWATRASRYRADLTERYKAEELAAGPLSLEAVKTITAAADAYRAELEREEAAHRQRRNALRATFDQIVAAAVAGATS